MKLMSVVLFIAIAAYIGLYIYKSSNQAYTTAPAMYRVVEDSAEARGYIVRNESILDGRDGALTLMADEGEKVASGQVVAVYYEGDRALEQASEIRRLQLLVQELEQTAQSTSSMRELDADACVRALAEAVQRKTLGNLQDLTYSINNQIFKNAEVESGEYDIDVLRGQIAALTAAQTNTVTVYAPQSGVFSAVVDGYEGYDPSSLDAITPSALEARYSVSIQREGALGKLISGITWYYAAVMDEQDAQKLADRSSVTLQFTETYNEKVDMKIESIGEPEGGRCVVVFSSQRNLAALTTVRALTASVEFSAFSGLAIPAESLYYDEDGAYIYLLTGLQAEKVSVDVLCEQDDGVVLRNGAENGTVLREGAEVIVTDEEIYDGKVVVE